nr:hypothetical protein [Corallococcus exiguus]
MVLQGSSVVLGRGDHFAAVRITSSGSQDMTFGTSGIAKSEGGQAHALVARPNGGLLLAGERQDAKVGGEAHGVLKLVAYTADGKPDVTFGPAGVRELTAPVGVLDVVDVSGLRIQTDGKILVFADVYAKPVLFRLLANGELDMSFGTPAWCAGRRRRWRCRCSSAPPPDRSWPSWATRPSSRRRTSSRPGTSPARTRTCCSRARGCRPPDKKPGLPRGRRTSWTDARP